MSALGGEITVRSTPGAGSVFRVVIPPATRGRRSPAGRVGAGKSPDARRARILLVDDEPMILESLRRALARYEVQTLTRAREALERIVAGERFDVIFCDLLMPGMSGMELSEELSRAAPEQAARIVFTTGGAFTARAREFLDRAKNPCIEKPFDLRRLHALIQEIAGEGRG